MKKVLSATALLAILGFAFAGFAARRDDDGQRRDALRARGETILEFDTMFPLSGAFKGATNAIRNIPGAGADWKIGRVDGELKADGKLEIDVFGLVLVGTGANPIPAFQGTVSCLSFDAAGTVITSNVQTGQFPANAMGDAHIEQRLQLPSPCVAPIVFVNIPVSATRPNGAWIAVTGK